MKKRASFVSDPSAKISHYEVQKARRSQFIKDWRGNHLTVVKRSDVTSITTQRGMSEGPYLGIEAGRPIRTVDAKLNEIPGSSTTSLHRHSWDAVSFCVGGSAWTEIDGIKFTWREGDSFHIPAWSWHRHGNESTLAAQFLSFSSEPLMNLCGFAIIEDQSYNPTSQLEDSPSQAAPIAGNDINSIRIRRLSSNIQSQDSRKLYTRWEDLEFRQTPRGTRTTFLIDSAIGYRTSGLTMAMMEISPGRAQSMHRHSGEAWLYVVDGNGHSVIGDTPTDGIAYPWTKGDLIAVDHYSWHQHFNDSDTQSARLIRVHILDVLLNTLNALCYPLNLLEEPPDEIRSAQTGDISNIVWPEVTRPTWP